ncbi:NAD(P)/FAD-dependent oxidoreductase [Corticibacterium sp. UT-5YL-CI-8]|nr:NAD(P)/FAD-dependent oxidoreductase [Tianweitania sp. UT-5YL-CI-8]
MTDAVTADRIDPSPAGKGSITGTFDAVVVGAGFAGMYMLYRLRALGLSVRVFEAGAGVGGTWFWNRYPGARCDVESMQYSYSFSRELEQEWNWSELYAAQPEILAYANHVADRFDLRRDIQFETRVTAAHYGETEQGWIVGTDRDDLVYARFCIMASGQLSSLHPPEIPGFDQFQGDWHHTGAWPHDPVDLKGRSVGIIGTGSSGTQAVPVVAKEAGRLYVFQRTPNYVLPSPNKAMTPEYAGVWKAHADVLRRKAHETRTGILYNFGTKSALDVSDDERTAEFSNRWKTGSSILAAYTDFFTNIDANGKAAEFVRDQIRTIVKDPATAARLTPTDYPIGAKRICIDSHYYQAFNRENVELVDIKAEPIERFDARGLQTTRRAIALDVIILATGFDAVTGALARIDIRGREGQPLASKWQDGPTAFLGLMISGFPNLFTVNGPGSPAALSNVLMSIEHHVDWIAGCVQTVRARNCSTVEPSQAAEYDWTNTVAEAGRTSLFQKAASWFNGANVAGKPKQFLVYVGGIKAYREKCSAVVANGYRDFIFE